jgi:hypothetical protein
MRATTERIAAVEGLADTVALGFGGDVLRYRVTTPLGDDAIAAALGLQKMGLVGSKLLLAADPKSPRAMRAEARLVILEIARMINLRPKPQWRSAHKPIFEGADTTQKKLQLLGLDPEMLSGVNYKPADYKVLEEGDRYNANYKIFAGKDWTPAPGVDNDSESVAFIIDEDGERTDRAPPKAEERWVGMLVTRNAWSESTIWADAEGARMESFDGDRSETDSNGKLRVQEGADWLRDILKHAVARRLNKPSPPVRELPAGKGWQLFNKLDADNLRRWNDPYGIHNLELSWSRRASDKHYIAKLVAYHAGHAFYLEAEVDADVVYGVYKEKGEDLAKLTEVELGDALKWIVGPESGPEVFAERRAEARAAMDAMFASMGKLPAVERAAVGTGAVSEKAFLDLGCAPGKHFKPGDYSIRSQALGDVEISAGTPVTGGRWWILGNPETGKLTRSER